MTDVLQVRNIRNHLGDNIEGSEHVFAAMWPTGLSMDRLHEYVLKSPCPYFVAPRPHGHRFILYINSRGDVFLENQARHVFQLEEEHSVNILSRGGTVCADTVLDGTIARAKSNMASDDNACSESKLTFIITDAARYNGQDLTKMSVIDRLACIKVSKRIANYV